MSIAAAAAYSKEHAGRGFVARTAGQVVFEEFVNADENTRFDMQSATKCLSGLIGVSLMKQGIIPCLSVKVSSYIPSFRDAILPRKRACTVKNLICLVSGMEAGPAISTVTYETAANSPFSHQLGDFDYGGYPFLTFGLFVKNAIAQLGYTANDPVKRYIDDHVFPGIQWQYADGTTDEPLLNHGALMTTRDAAALGQFLLDHLSDPDYAKLIADGEYFWPFTHGWWKTTNLIGSGGLDESDRLPYAGVAAKGLDNQRIYVFPNAPQGPTVIARNGDADETYDDADFVELIPD